MFESLLKPESRIRTWMIATCVVLLLAIGGLSIALFHLSTSYRAQDEKLQELQKRSVIKHSQKPTKSQLETQQSWERLVAEISYPWNPIFLSLERAADPEIELLLFEPDKKNRHIVLGGEAKNQKALEQFLRKLEGDTNFFNVHLTHQEKVKRERLETIGFEIKAYIR